MKKHCDTLTQYRRQQRQQVSDLLALSLKVERPGLSKKQKLSICLKAVKINESLNAKELRHLNLYQK